jgi:hypothetical protein
MWAGRLSRRMTCMSSFFGPTKDAGSGDLTIRLARASDALQLFRVAAMDSSRVPTGRVLLAIVGDEVWAAVSVETLQAVADPFRPSGDLIPLLIERARQLRREERKAERGRRRAAFRLAFG